MTESGFRKRTVALLFTLLLLRFWLGQTFELTESEAYSWMKGRHLDWGYWDQSPLVPFLSWLGTVFFGQTELGVRWLAAVIYAATGFLLFYLGRHWFHARIGFICVLLFALVPTFAWSMLLLSEATVGVGLMAVALFAYHRILENDRWRWWLAGAAVTALAVSLSWWNLFWAIGFLWFRARDSLRSGRFLQGKVIAFVGLTLFGFWPFFFWLARRGLMADGLGIDWNLLLPHQYISYPSNVFSFFRDQPIWFSAAGLGAFIAFILRRRGHDFFGRNEAFLLFMSLPGLCAQFFQVMLSVAGLPRFFTQHGLGFLGQPNQDVVIPLYLPILILIAAVACRLAAAFRHARFVLRLLLVSAGVATLLGFLPGTPICGSSFTATSSVSYRALAAEVARVQREVGATLIITSSPQLSSTLSFYLPLQPFVYVLSQPGIQDQFDLWTSYYDFGGAHAVLVTTTAEAPAQIIREFAEVRALPEVQVPGQPQWYFFFCQRYGAGQ